MQTSKKLYPLVVTEKLAATRRFYVDQLGYHPSIDMEHYLQIRFGSEDDDPEMAFMSPNAGEELGKQKVFDGDGLIVSVPTEDPDSRHRELLQSDVEIAQEPTDRPWKWRSFIVVDPNGVKLDFYRELHSCGPESNRNEAGQSAS